MKFSIIYSADYDFQVLEFVNGDSEKAWFIANAKFTSGEYAINHIEHYDVAEFNSTKDMNNWIIEQVTLGREKLHPIKRSFINLYAQAAKEIIGNDKMEEWLDDNSDKLDINITTIQQARAEIKKYYK